MVVTKVAFVFRQVDNAGTALERGVKDCLWVMKNTRLYLCDYSIPPRQGRSRSRHDECFLPNAPMYRIQSSSNPYKRRTLFASSVLYSFCPATMQPPRPERALRCKNYKAD